MSWGKKTEEKSWRQTSLTLCQLDRLWGPSPRSQFVFCQDTFLDCYFNKRPDLICYFFQSIFAGVCWLLLWTVASVILEVPAHGLVLGHVNGSATDREYPVSSHLEEKTALQPSFLNFCCFNGELAFTKWVLISFEGMFVSCCWSTGLQYSLSLAK